MASKGDQTGTVRKFELGEIASADQTPLLFSCARGETYMYNMPTQETRQFMGKERESRSEKRYHIINNIKKQCILILYTKATP